MAWEAQFLALLEKEKKGTKYSKGMVRHYNKLTKEHCFHCCTECDLAIGKYPGRPLRYCPNCGADMYNQDGYPRKELRNIPTWRPGDGSLDLKDKKSLSERVEAWENMNLLCEAVHAKGGWPMVPWSPNGRVVSFERFEENCSMYRFSVYAPFEEAEGRIVSTPAIHEACEEDDLHELVGEAIARAAEELSDAWGSITRLQPTLEAYGPVNWTDKYRKSATNPVTTGSGSQHSFHKMNGKDEQLGSGHGPSSGTSDDQSYMHGTGYRGYQHKQEKDKKEGLGSPSGSSQSSATPNLPVGAKVTEDPDTRNQNDYNKAFESVVGSAIDAAFESTVDDFGGTVPRHRRAIGQEADIDKDTDHSPAIDVKEAGHPDSMDSRLGRAKSSLGESADPAKIREEFYRQLEKEDKKKKKEQSGDLGGYTGVGPFDEHGLQVQESWQDRFARMLEQEGSGDIHGGSSDRPAEDATRGSRQYEAAVAVIVKDGKEVLLGKVPSTSGDDRAGYWAFPGGGIDEEDGNDPVRAAIREAFEEAAVRVTSTGTVINHKDRPGVAFVVCEYVNGDPEPNKEFVSWEWCPHATRQEHPSIYPVNREVLERLPNGKITEKVEPAKEKDVDPKELKMGIDVEMEHTDSRETAKRIALEHLAEDPKYYTQLKKVHVEKKDTRGRDITPRAVSGSKVGKKARELAGGTSGEPHSRSKDGTSMRTPKPQKMVNPDIKHKEAERQASKALAPAGERGKARDDAKRSGELPSQDQNSETGPGDEDSKGNGNGKKAAQAKPATKAPTAPQAQTSPQAAAPAQPAAPAPGAAQSPQQGAPGQAVAPSVQVKVNGAGDDQAAQNGQQQPGQPGQPQDPMAAAQQGMVPGQVQPGQQPAGQMQTVQLALGDKEAAQNANDWLIAMGFQNLSMDATTITVGVSNPGEMQTLTRIAGAFGLELSSLV